ncbi:Tripartite tricarboxylate transporter TctB family protein [Thalassovita litoralis]|jgi:hypothetical protein|uniref:Tripartite tricarboxylate transporter TctB family protein n=1 Tax=Thalassovita litoralis TaxID=1010611 RepID=A0A521FHS8_9RHOB|nr:tripartite tricarboxylate transporter TctB family protein [Thalassovita litoralis]SMO95619.1 Tripartite tricarboxylate transporter TctB family protein [Thalassovita litoralis]
MKKADFVSGLILGVFGLTMLIFVIPAQIETAPEGYISPRLVPNLTMILITGLSALLMLRSLRGIGYTPMDDSSVFFRSEMMALLKISGVFAVSVALFAWSMPLLAGIALIVGTLIALGERRPLVIVVMPTGLLLVVWLVFYRLLGTVIV